MSASPDGRQDPAGPRQRRAGQPRADRRPVLVPLRQRVAESPGRFRCSGHRRGAGGRLAFTTDSYVVRPLFFPGGDIGKLAVCGTVNDLSMAGREPALPQRRLHHRGGLPAGGPDAHRGVDGGDGPAGRRVTSSPATPRWSSAAAPTACSSTRPASAWCPPGVRISGRNARPGDAILLSGTIGDHGMAVMSQREGLRFATTLESDCAPLNGLVAAMLDAAPRHPRAARSHARRPGHHAERVGRQLGRRHRAAGRAHPGASGITPMVEVNRSAPAERICPAESKQVLTRIPSAISETQ